MGRKMFLGPNPYAREPHHGAHEWISRFSRQERHAMNAEDRAARNSVLLVLATAVLGGLGVLIATLVWFVRHN